MAVDLKHTPKYDRNPELIRRYREGDESAGEELALLNRPLVARLASRYASRGVDLDELTDIGTVGLVKAINTFDHKRECAFSTYAVPLILGEIRRFLRDDGIIKVSREEKRLLASLTRERERRLLSGEDTSLRALAEAVGVSIEDAASALTAGIAPRSLDECAYEEEGATLASLVYDDEDEERRFDALSIKMVIEALPDLERKLILLRYFKDFSQIKTASILGITQVKVSRLEKKILAFMKTKLT